MKKIESFRSLLGVHKNSTLIELRNAYRSLMKEWHPDKFTDDSQKKEAEEKSKRFINAYHFLVSIAPETHAANEENYEMTLESSNIKSYEYKNEVLTIDFSDGSTYEYFDVTKTVYNKMLNATSMMRFAKRNICRSFTYRSTSKLVANPA